MKKSRRSIPSIDSNKEPKPFDHGNEFESLVDAVFLEPRRQLHEVVEELTKLLHYVDEMISEDYEGVEQALEQAELHGFARLAKLKRLNRELHQQIGAVHEIKFDVFEAIDRLKEYGRKVMGSTLRDL